MQSKVPSIELIGPKSLNPTSVNSQGNFPDKFGKKHNVNYFCRELNAV